MKRRDRSRSRRDPRPEDARRDADDPPADRPSRHRSPDKSAPSAAGAKAKTPEPDDAAEAGAAALAGEAVDSPSSPRAMIRDESASPAATARARRRWYKKKRNYAWAFLVSLIYLVLGIWYSAVHYPGWFVLRILERTGGIADVSKTSWNEDGSLHLTWVRVGDYLRVPSIDLKWNWWELLRYRRMEEITINDPRLYVGLLRESLKKQEKTATPFKIDQLQVEIGRLRIAKGTVILDGLGPDVPPIDIPLGENNPIELLDLRLGERFSSPSLDVPQTITIRKLRINSPFDALSPVITARKIDIHFTWRGLIASTIDGVIVMGPTLYLGPDFFWFTDQFSKAKTEKVKTEQGDPVVQPWLMKVLKLEKGHLAINVTGKPSITLPPYFESESNDIHLDRLDEMTTKGRMVLPETSYDYPDYKVKISKLAGKIEFNLPLGTETKNLVNVIKMDQIAWNELGATQAWLSVTFNRDGIFGELGGDCYGGYLNGKMGVDFKDGYPWYADLSVTNVSATPVAMRLADKYIAITGGVKGNLSVKGLSRVIQKCDVKMAMTKPGQLHIKAVDDLVQKISPEWSPIKRDITRVFLEAFRVYNYTTGTFDMTYGVPKSTANLQLNGREGVRKFDLAWTQEGEGVKLPESIDPSTGAAKPGSSGDGGNSIVLQTTTGKPGAGGVTISSGPIPGATTTTPLNIDPPPLTTTEPKRWRKSLEPKAQRTAPVKAPPAAIPAPRSVGSKAGK